MQWTNVYSVALAAFAVAAVFGAVAHKTNFCTMGAVSDWMNMGDKGRLRAWFAATGVAVLGAQLLHVTGQVDLGKTMYLIPTFSWLMFLTGGVMFGVGMTLASGCGQRNLVRFGGGNLKAMVVLVVLGLTAYATLRGALAWARLGIERVNVPLDARFGLGDQGLPGMLAAASGIPADTARLVVTGVLGLGLLAFAFKDREYRGSFDNVLAGMTVGGAVVAGWYITGRLGADDFEPVGLESMSFVLPVGNALQYLMTFTGSTISYGVATVGGVIAGACAYAVASGKFRLETFSNRADMARHLAGGLLMGVGGVFGFGCTIGQGVTGMSTLALGSLLTLGGIILGSAWTMRMDYRRMEGAGFFGSLGAGLVDVFVPSRRA